MRASAGVFHNRVTLNDSTLLGGNPPFQPMVDVSQRQRGQPRRRRRRGGSAVRDHGAGRGLQAPDVLHVVDRRAARGAARLRPGRHLRRPSRAVPAARAQHQPAAGRARCKRTRASTSRRCGRITGTARSVSARTPGDSNYNSLQISADRRYTNGLKVGVAYTLGKSEDNASDKRNILWNTYDDTNYWGPSSFDRRHVLNVYYIYDLPFWRDAGPLMKSALGGWQVSGATFLRTGTPFSIIRTDDIAGVGDGDFGQP